MTRMMLLALCLAACAPADEDSQPALEEEGSAPCDGSCLDRGNFDVDVFADEILPLLRGEVDLNRPGGSFVGCSRAPCHGFPLPGGGLLIADGATPEETLESFACFVDLDRPRRSQVLVCPSNDQRCAVQHLFPPFIGPDDLNYRRILAYIRASRL